MVKDKPTTINYWMHEVVNWLNILAGEIMHSCFTATIIKYMTRNVDYETHKFAGATSLLFYWQVKVAGATSLLFYWQVKIAGATSISLCKASLL